jgi:hypothetical protein
MALLELHRGKTIVEVAALLNVSYPTVHSWVGKYRAEGLAFLKDKARTGRPVVYDGMVLPRRHLPKYPCPPDVMFKQHGNDFFSNGFHFHSFKTFCVLYKSTSNALKILSTFCRFMVIHCLSSVSATAMLSEIAVLSSPGD